MGRSVGYLNNASGVAYIDVRDMEDSFEWDLMVEEIEENLTAKYPSLYSCDEWEGREEHIFLKNNLINIAMSEYCGLATLSVAPRDDFYYSEPHEGLANRMADYVGKYIEETFGEYRKLGTFSNGEGVYERIAS